MRNFLSIFTSFLILFLATPAIALTPPQPPTPPLAPQPPDPPTRLIVTYRTQVPETEKENLISQLKAEKLKRLTIVNSDVLVAKESQVGRITENSNVLRVERDVQVQALSHCQFFGNCPTPTPTPAVTASTQVLPWGVDRVDAEKIWTTTTADPIKVGVLDTGIDLSHPDLQGNIKGGVNTIRPWRTAADDNGHGTHVAGIIAALNNTIGVVGVGPAIDLYAVKVLDRNGSGWISDVIEGLQWSATNNMQVVNMSLGLDTDVQSFHDAVIAAKAAGITEVAAAGNSGPGDATVIYPAKYPEVIAVAATNKTDGQPWWSSTGPEVDLAAPGDAIYSTYRGGIYKTLSGTSMSAPHVTGAAAVVLATHGGFTPDQVQNHLQSTAEKLIGLSTNQQGAGLVDVEKAVLTP